MGWKSGYFGAAMSPPPDEKERPPSSDRFVEMDSEQIRAQMEESERRAAEAERLANQQRALVGALARNGRDADEARRLLRILEERLALEEAERDRMRRELVALKRREG